MSPVLEDMHMCDLNTVVVSLPGKPLGLKRTETVHSYIASQCSLETEFCVVCPDGTASMRIGLQSGLPERRAGTRTSVDTLPSLLTVPFLRNVS